jgi:hypothetical protein
VLLATGLIDERRWHRYSRPGGQATADEESACETAGSPRATIGLAIGLATAAEGKKREITTGGGSHPTIGAPADSGHADMSGAINAAL